jgi:hypothetical protein
VTAKLVQDTSPETVFLLGVSKKTGKPIKPRKPEKK